MPLPEPSRSAHWQPEALAANQALASAFLTNVAATGLLQAVAERSIELLALAPGHTALEVGCGNGVFLPRLAAAVGPAGRVEAIDHAPVFVEESRARLRSAQLDSYVSVQLGDAYRLPFADAHFDGAHCERVLLHLENPDAALREMVRVVRPGRRVVAAEPDWGALRIDHPDREAFDEVYRRTSDVRHPDMGLTLYRRLQDAGLAEVRVMPVWGVMHDYNLVKLYGLSLQRGIDAAVAAGVLTRERAEALEPGLQAAHDAGRFVAIGPFHVAAGVVPAR